MGFRRLVDKTRSNRIILFHTDTTLIDRPIDSLASPVETLLPLVRNQFVVRLSFVCLSFFYRLSLVRVDFFDYKGFWYMPPSVSFILYIYTTHTHTHIYIYIYSYTTHTYIYIVINCWIVEFCNFCSIGFLWYIFYYRNSILDGYRHVTLFYLQMNLNHIIYTSWTEYLVNQEKYFYLILFHINTSLFITGLVLSTIEMMLFAYFQHICGIFKVFRIKQKYRNSSRILIVILY